MNEEENELVAGIEETKQTIEETASLDTESPNHISMADSLVALNPEAELNIDQIKEIADELGVDPNNKFDVTNPQELNSLLLGVSAYQNNSTIEGLSDQNTSAITQIAGLEQTEAQQVAGLEHKPEEAVMPG